ncbi:MAG: hypothetical protein M3R61_11235 [Chloroflexota bacterium]|nr:hypothetical protein [Chloroflexota bacterium]
MSLVHTSAPFAVISTAPSSRMPISPGRQMPGSNINTVPSRSTLSLYQTMPCAAWLNTSAPWIVPVDEVAGTHDAQPIPPTQRAQQRVLFVR